MSRKIEPVIRFPSTDGVLHETYEKAIAHEESPQAMLVGLTAQDLIDAMSGVNVPVADAIEKIGTSLKSKRLKEGVRLHRDPTTGKKVAL